MKNPGGRKNNPYKREYEAGDVSSVSPSVCWGSVQLGEGFLSCPGSTHPNTASLTRSPGISAGGPEHLLQGRFMLVSLPGFLPGLGFQQLFCMSESPHPARGLSFPTCTTQRNRVTELTQNWKRQNLEQGVPQSTLTDRKARQANAPSRGRGRDSLLTSSALAMAERGCRRAPAH